MSKSRKHLIDEIYNSYPEPKENESIVKVVESRGNNTLQVLHPDGRTELCSIPYKFNKKIWIKRGNFVIIQVSKIPNATGKIHSVVLHALFEDQIKYLQDNNLWPEAFEIESKKKSSTTDAYFDFPSSDEDEEEEDEDEEEDDEEEEGEEEEEDEI